MDISKFNDKDLCEKCEEKEGENTICPRISEIYGEEEECFCCEDCQKQCYMDI